MGEDLSLKALTRPMVESEEKWEAVESFAESTMGAKETAEREGGSGQEGERTSGRTACAGVERRGDRKGRGRGGGGEEGQGGTTGTTTTTRRDATRTPASREGREDPTAERGDPSPGSRRVGRRESRRWSGSEAGPPLHATTRIGAVRRWNRPHPHAKRERGANASGIAGRAPDGAWDGRVTREESDIRTLGYLAVPEGGSRGFSR